jgi:hypothetical protein
MAHPHPYGEATAALFIATIPALAVVGLLVGDRVEAFRRRSRPVEVAAEHPLARLESLAGLE